MTVSTMTLSPNTTAVLGLGAVAEPFSPVDSAMLARVRRPDFPAWLAHVAPAAACTRPVRMRLEAEWPHSSGSLDVYRVTDDMPDQLMYVACKNRRASVCPACAEVYRQDTYQLIKAGLMGGKGVPDTVTDHPCFFVTLTAPSFGPVHSRAVGGNGQVRPCRMRRNIQVCRHGKLLTCHRRHTADDPELGEPICLDCYDYDHQAVWNLHAGELWRRTTIALNRRLAAAARAAGLTWQIGKTRGVRVRLSFAKVAEYQRRGVVHFHALIRLDGYDPLDPDRIITPDPAITPDHLAAYIEDATQGTAFTTAPHPRNRTGWPIHWGTQVDIRPVRLQPGDLDDAGTLTTTAVAAYLAKYATKATEEAGHTSRRLTDLAIELVNDDDTHQARQLRACWSLGRRPFYMTTAKQREDWADGWGKLQKWAHMLGFGGHFSTKSRRYSTTLTALRAVRRAFQRGEPIDPPAEDPACDADQQGDELAVILRWIFDGTGWLTTADAELANSSAARARERRHIAREEIGHQLAA